MRAALIPIKSLAQAKGRLGGVLTRQERRELVLSMFREVVLALTGSGVIDRVFVVSPDEEVLRRGVKWGAVPVLEKGAERGNLNRSLTKAARLLSSQGARHLLVIPGDVPLVTSRDIERMMGAARKSPSVVIVPSLDGEGTNALAMSPPGIIPFGFGQGSFRRHVHRALRRKVDLRVIRLYRVALDIDLPRDLELFYRKPCLTGGSQIER